MTAVGGGGAESADTAPQTGSTPPRASRGLSGGSSFSACQLNGSAQVTPRLDSSSQTFSYSLSAGLEGCESSEEDAPAAGALSAGEVISAQVTNTLTGETDTVDYQEPIPLGAGSCEDSTTQGQALVRWEDGTDTVISYSTTGALDEMSFSGSVTPVMTLAAVDPAPGDPVTLVIGTTRHLGGSATGGLVLRSPDDPSACPTPTGETTIVVGGDLAFDSP